ncbi:phosphoribosylpyrophosphate synthetase [Rhodocytophaga aerolata]|uniref:Phosphoribosylpyrophosphate synthetase n=1 Tax=Rhodocytophaga aerolata TaxID=455078 RepID=A0ABT8RBV8_9BACT|nr:phosphoribosylpyrophosphate synthetase [Rhodocytophaga aerolata]MDO1449597.1 phosphoribosylpyrophosphate synthetase [Rhodocytophaga aerolata]
MATSSKDYNDLVDATNDLKARGYNCDFKIVNNDDPAREEDAPECKLLNLSSGKEYRSEELKIREHYRFEGPSNPGDMSVIYAIECEGGEKGVVIDAFGTYSSRRLTEFFRSIPIETDPSQAV